MIESLFVLGAGLTWGYIVGLLFIFGIFGLSIFKESGLAMTAIVVIAAITLATKVDVSSISWLAVLGYSVTYIAGGVLWALFKWRRFAKSTAEKLRKESPDISDDRIIESINEDRDLDIVYYWVVGWPFSAFGWAFYDSIMDAIKKLGKTFDKITESVVKGL